MAEKILIVEDEVIVALEIERTIEKLGYESVGLATDYEGAVRKIREDRPDLMIIDIMLKGEKTGIDIAKEVGKDSERIPFIYLTSVTDETWMREAITTGPSGYLLKPFRREELQSAILLSLYKSGRQSGLPDMETEQNGRIALGYGYFYDEKIDRLFFEDRYLPLGLKERSLLRLLFKAAGKIVPFQILEESIWEGEPVSDSTLRTLIYRLKTKTDPRLIETVTGLGCRLLIGTGEEDSLEKGADA